jgi:FtsP/CotA-like multicopper oxidase with cupredoxin domain
MRAAVHSSMLGLLLIGAVCATSESRANAPAVDADACARPSPGSELPEPKDLRSRGGELNLDLAVRNSKEPDGSIRYCYVLPDGSQSPTLRLHPGDTLVLRLKNELVDLESPSADSAAASAQKRPAGGDPCTSGIMSGTSTNLHFHGLTVPARCHQDEVLKTSIQPDDPPFEYRVKVPPDQPPGLYWYHPHIHGFSSKEVSGGASGALIIEGLERANREVLGLPERVLIIRDHDLLNPDAPPSKSEPVVPKLLLDSDGDAGNNNTGYGKPAKDLSVNYVSVPYPDYPPAVMKIKPGERQLWRVLNASSVTYLHLALIYDHVPQPFGVVAIDGVSINASGQGARDIARVDHVGVPPGGRVELVVQGPPMGVAGLLITRSVDTGLAGENDPNRPLVSVVPSAVARKTKSTLAASAQPLPPAALPWLGDVAPVRVRKLFFSEMPSDPSDPKSPTVFFITQDGQTPRQFDPNSSTPDIVVNQGDVEDWVIENRSVELHAFHIHQLHFLLLDWFGLPVNEPFLRDTVNVPYFDNHMLSYPSVKLRMDFRDPNSVGTFAFHCHLLEHEDGGMMGTIRVEAADNAKRQETPSTPTVAR